MGMGVVQSVLILDDDERVASSIARSLVMGRAVYTANDAVSGLALARQRRPDLVIVDLRLGSACGLDVIRAIRAELPAALIALISGYVSTDVTVLAVKAGADAVISKPVTAGDLLRRLTAAGPVNVANETPSLAQVEAEHIARVLTDCDGNISEAARRLGIYRSSLQRKLRKRDMRSSARSRQ